MDHGEWVSPYLFPRLHTYGPPSPIFRAGYAAGFSAFVKEYHTVLHKAAGVRAFRNFLLVSSRLYRQPLANLSHRLRHLR